MKKIVTIVGYGTMGKAISSALSRGDTSLRIFAADKGEKNWDKISKSDFIVLSVKPRDAGTAIKKLKNCGLNKKTILISVMAGFPIGAIASLSRHKKIIRMMPNLGLSVGAGIAAWKKSGLSEKEASEAKKLISKVTDNFEVKDENIIDKVTAISGSGPAYFFLLADYLVKASRNLGFTERESGVLVEKTFSASALLGKNSDYSLLIKKIVSKGGTTEAALKVFQKKNFDRIVSEAVHAAYKKAREISRKL